MHLADRLHEEWNPVVRDNGALGFRHWSFFWGANAAGQLALRTIA
jgi:hypothetical protein